MLYTFSKGVFVETHTFSEGVFAEIHTFSKGVFAEAKIKITRDVCKFFPRFSFLFLLMLLQ